MTVAEVGEAWRDRFEPGQRFVLQADIYYRGKNLAYGYVFVGGLAQYSLLGPAALDGDEGCYAIPVPEGMGYAEVALTEPWACVEAAYVPRRRLHVKKDGVLWIIGRPGLERAYRLGETLCCGLPRRVIATDVPASLVDQFTWPPVGACSTASSPSGFAALDAGGGARRLRRRHRARSRPPRCSMRCPSALAPGAVVNLVGERPLGRPVQVDAGRVHYDYTVYVGTRGPDMSRGVRRGAQPGGDPRRAARPGSSAAAGRWAGCTCSACWRWTTGRDAIVVSESNVARNPELIADFGPLGADARDRADRAQPPADGGRRPTKRRSLRLHGGARLRRHRRDRRQRAGHRGRHAAPGARRPAADLRRAGARHDGRSSTSRTSTWARRRSPARPARPSTTRRPC